MKKLYLLAITFVIAGLMITSATSMPTANNSNEELTADSIAVPSSLVNAVTKENVQGSASLFAGSALTGGDYNEYRPALAADTNQRFFVGFDYTEDGTTYYPAFTYSTDNGINWEDGGYFPDSAGASNPVADYKSTGFYASFNPNPSDETNGQIWLIDGTIIEEIAGSQWDFGSYDIDTFEDVHIATYTHAGPSDDGAWNWGALAMTGFNGYGSTDVFGCPYIFYQTDSGGNGQISWLNNAAGCEHATIDIDLVTNMSYAVFDRLVTGQYQILVRKDNFGVWTSDGGHSLVTTKTITSTGNLTYPSVIADQNNVLIAAQSDAAGNQDIVCYYSTNGMNSNTMVVVADTGGDELYPQISWLKSGVAVCTYLRGSEAYYKATEDGGATWSAEARVSDEQISPVENHALTTYGVSGKAYAIWQDGRGANIDIYYDNFYEVTAPNVQIGTVAGGIGKVTMDVTNTGTGEATDVAWSITVKGGLLGRINVTTSGVIPTLAAGGSEIVQTDSFIFGFGAITIQCTAGLASASKTGKVLIFLVRNIA